MSWVDKFFGEKEKAKPYSDVFRPNSPRRDTSATEIRNQEMEPYYNGKMSGEDIEHQLQKIAELQEITPLDDSLWPKGSQDPMSKIQQQAETLPKAEVQQSNADLPIGAVPKGVNQPKEAKTVYIPRYFEEETKLTIILVENTSDVVKHKDKLVQIVNSLVVAGLVCVINYGKIVREPKVVDTKDFNCKSLLYEEFAGNNACLFDALIALEDVVKKYYKDIIEETKFKRKKIKNIEIIGIGRCVDNCSISSSQFAIESFSKVVKHRDINSKYFCLSEESFMQAATIGFHSIGAISRNYM